MAAHARPMPIRNRSHVVRAQPDSRIRGRSQAHPPSRSWSRLHANDGHRPFVVRCAVSRQRRRAGR